MFEAQQFFKDWSLVEKGDLEVSNIDLQTEVLV